MKPIYSIFAVWLAGAAAVSGQELVKVEVVMEQTQYLPNESLVVGVRITNQSGQPLEFGHDNDWLSFTLEGAKNKPVPKIRPLPVKGAFTAESMARTTAKFDLAPYYDLGESGNYVLTATVTIKTWGRAIISEPKRFDIVKGTTLWKQEFGVPNADVTGGPPEVRKYVVQQSRQKDQLTLYVRITDAGERRVIKMFSVGAVMNFGQPEFQLDKFSNLHLLHQDGRQTYNHCVVNPDGNILIRHSYQIVGRPRLVSGESGLISVAGGQRIASPTDLPKPPEEQQISQSTAP
jgi:hypothetical protein